MIDVIDLPKQPAAAKRSASVYLLQTAIGDYRQAVLEKVIEDCPGGFQVMTGREYFDPTVKTGVELGPHLQYVKNHFILRRRLLWQSGMWRSLVAADAVIFEFNPRILSTWALLAIRRLSGRRNVLWGHAWPRSGSGSRTFLGRRLMSKLGNTILVYTETQAKELAAALPNARIIAAPNALYSAASMAPAQGNGPIQDFIYVGRLVPEKKPDLLIRAFALARSRLGPASRLIVVGDGPMRRQLEEDAAQLLPSGGVTFAGHVAEPARLRELYATAVASVSPGYVGLSLTQSFSFGVPMIIARDEPHAPEIEAAVEGENSVFFQEDSAERLAEAMAEVWQTREHWLNVRDAIARDCADRYSIELMASRLISGATA